MRIVLDSNILVRANPIVPPEGLARDLLLKTIAGPHVLIVSVPILVEVRRVLSYPHVQARWPLTPIAIEQYLDLLASVGVVVDVGRPSSPVIISDPDDDPILQTAIMGKADVLCTRDEAFRHQVVASYCKSHHVRIVSDIELMHQLRQAPER